MRRLIARTGIVALFSLSTLMLASCSTTGYNNNGFSNTYPGTQASRNSNYYWNQYTDYSERLPSHMNTNGKRVVLVDPKEHVWGAYDSDGQLMRAGLATAGGNFCPDTQRPCRTSVGSFRINSLGEFSCKSSKYPLPRGGGLMPYCMFFNNDQALHGSPDGAVVEDNVSHGCVRMRIQDAEWIRYNFASVGTKVVVMPY